MKRIVCITLLVCSLFALNSCNIFGGVLWDGHQTADKVFYGVGDHIDELNNTCVLIPGVGHVAMPSLEDGTVPSFKKGDLIEITFKGVSNDLEMMQCYPARFGGNASEIKVVSANVELGYMEDGGCLITVDRPDSLANVSVGDSLILKTKVEESGDFIEKDFASCTVEEITDKKMKISTDADTSEILREMLYERLWFAK